MSRYSTPGNNYDPLPRRQPANKAAPAEEVDSEILSLRPFLVQLPYRQRGIEGGEKKKNDTTLY